MLVVIRVVNLLIGSLVFNRLYNWVIRLVFLDKNILNNFKSLSRLLLFRGYSICQPHLKKVSIYGSLKQSPVSNPKINFLKQSAAFSLSPSSHYNQNKPTNNYPLFEPNYSDHPSPPNSIHNTNPTCLEHQPCSNASLSKTTNPMNNPYRYQFNNIVHGELNNFHNKSSIASSESSNKLNHIPSVRNYSG